MKCPSFHNRNLPRPFFQKECVTLYHGDSIELLPKLGKFDWMFVDPPYGTMTNGYGRMQNHQGNKGREIANDHNLDLMEAILLDIRPAENVCTFCHPKNMDEMFRILDLSEFNFRDEFIWNKKTAGLGSGVRYQHECILTAVKEKRVMKSRTTIFDAIAPARRNSHPHEKPLSVVAYILDIIKPKSVIDPFAGTVVIGEACLERGINYVGIEIELKWCELARKRLAQELIKFDETKLPIQTEHALG